eukprot:TRINITY_DN13438_c0_g4_i5.p1 TRINITY_DN13438_c0_g4~~TRINITY_DN13438_c0_g4_i5.p1  ORF type:complete len:174 (+),score=24.17 TRINITY_DN13438_c0_g4_i5:423-944(+)
MNLPSILLSSESLRFSLFPAIFAALAKGFLCGSRHIIKKDEGLQSFVAGFLAGLISLFVKKDGRTFWAIYLICQALDWSFTSFCHRKNIKSTYLYSTAIIGTAFGFMGAFAFGNAPYVLPKSVHSFWNIAGAYTKNELRYVEAYRYISHKTFNIDWKKLIEFHSKFVTGSSKR